MLDRFTLLDWGMVAVAAIFALNGLRWGGLRLVTMGFGRFAASLALATAGLVYIALPRRVLYEGLAQSYALPASSALPLAFLAAMLAAYVVIGPTGKILAFLFQRSFIGRTLDRLLGIPLGFAIGTVVALLMIALPLGQYRSFAAAENPSPVIRDSVLLPLADDLGRRLLEMGNHWWQQVGAGGVRR